MVYSHSLSLPWSVSPEDERRFRKILTITLVLTLAFGVVLPLLPVLKKPVEQDVELPPRLARLVGTVENPFFHAQEIDQLGFIIQDIGHA